MTGPLALLLDLLTRRRWMVALVIVMLGVRILISALLFAAPDGMAVEPFATDYSAFFVSGRLAWEGAVAQAYRLEDFLVAQQRLLGATEFLPWTYPPHFNLVTAVLALLPIWQGYLVFALLSLVAWLLAVRALAGAHFGLVLMAMWPAMAVGLNTGQNGLMFGALMAWLARAALAAGGSGRAVAGVPLALLTIKPHLLTGVCLWLLLQRRWRAILVGGVIALALLALATWLLKPSVWPAFFTAAGRVTLYLKAGLFPLERMVSLYAGFSRAGFASTPALALHSVGTLLWLGLLALAWWRGWPPAQQLAVALFATLFLTPYAYDYDVPVLGVALALLAPDLVRRGKPAQIMVILLLFWLAGACGAVFTDQLPDDKAAALALSRQLPALGGFLLHPAGLLLLWVVRRQSPVAA